MGAVLRFIAYALAQAWRYGLRAVNAVASWARTNWRRVLGWLNAGVGYGTILLWILEILGYR